MEFKADMRATNTEQDNLLEQFRGRLDLDKQDNSKNIENLNTGISEELAGLKIAMHALSSKSDPETLKLKLEEELIRKKRDILETRQAVPDLSILRVEIRSIIHEELPPPPPPPGGGCHGGGHRGNGDRGRGGGRRGHHC